MKEKVLIYCINNIDTEEFGVPMVYPTEKVAKAQFYNWIDATEKKDQQFDPDDFQLYYIGIYDTSSGEITACKPVKIASGGDIFEDEKEKYSK